MKYSIILKALHLESQAFFSRGEKTIFKPISSLPHQLLTGRNSVTVFLPSWLCTLKATVVEWIQWVSQFDARRCQLKHLNSCWMGCQEILQADWLSRDSPLYYTTHRADTIKYDPEIHVPHLLPNSLSLARSFLAGSPYPFFSCMYSCYLTLALILHAFCRMKTTRKFCLFTSSCSFLQ